MPSRCGGALGLDLVAHDADVFGLRADECDLVLVENLRETRVLGQKAVAWMDGVGAGDLAGRDNRGNVEIAVAGRRRPDAYALVGELDMHRVLVGGRIDRDGRDAELLGRAHDSERDFARLAIRILSNIEASSPIARNHRSSTLRRGHSMIINGWPYSTGEPSSTRMLTTLPAARRDDVVEGLHRLDKQQLVSDLHHRSNFDEGLGFGTGPQIGRSDHRRFHGAGQVGGWRLGCRRSAAEPCAGLTAIGRRSGNRGCDSPAGGRSLARQAHLQVAEADLDLAQIVFRHDLRELVDRQRHRQDFAQTRRFARRTASSFAFAREQEPTPRSTIGLSYIPPIRAKKVRRVRCGSCPARPYADVVKRNPAIRSDAVVADEDVDSPAVKKGRRRPNAFADEDARLHALEDARMQARPAALIAQLHDIALRDPKPRRIGWVDEHFRPLFSRTRRRRLSEARIEEISGRAKSQV